MMLDHLTNYLLQYKTVSIPHVGTLRLVQQPPQLNVANKQLEPPSYSVDISPEENVTDHQLNFLRRSAARNEEAVMMKLQLFGNSLRRKMSDGGFEWEGLGTINEQTRVLPLYVPALQAIPADKVIRQDAQHTVLVGDKEMTSDAAIEQNKITIKKNRPVAIYVGWIVLALSLLLIFFALYAGKFKPNAAGSKLSPASWLMPE